MTLDWDKWIEDHVHGCQELGVKLRSWQHHTEGVCRFHSNPGTRARGYFVSSNNSDLKPVN